jgi:hypothetical protein
MTCGRDALDSAGFLMLIKYSVRGVGATCSQAVAAAARARPRSALCATNEAAYSICWISFRACRTSSRLRVRSSIAS